MAMCVLARIKFAWTEDFFSPISRYTSYVLHHRCALTAPVIAKKLGSFSWQNFLTSRGRHVQPIVWTSVLKTLVSCHGWHPYCLMRGELSLVWQLFLLPWVSLKSSDVVLTYAYFFIHVVIVEDLKAYIFMACMI